MTTGRVFRRAAAPDPPVAVEAYGCTIRDADGREYLDAAGGAIVVNVGHGRREVVDAMAAQAGTARVCPRQRLHDRAARGVRRRRRAPPAARRRGHLSGVGRFGGDRDRPQAGPRLPPGARGDGTLDRLLALGQLPRQHARARWTCLAASHCAGRTRAGWVASATSRRPTRTGRGWPAPTRSGRPTSWPPSSTAPSMPPVRAPWPRSWPSRSSGRRWPPRSHPTTTGRRRRGLPAPRRPAHRRRGDDRVRPDGTLVRARPLGRPPRPAGGGQGRHVGLLAVRVRRRLGRDPRTR